LVATAAGPALAALAPSSAGSLSKKRPRSSSSNPIEAVPAPCCGRLMFAGSLVPSEGEGGRGITGKMREDSETVTGCDESYIYFKLLDQFKMLIK
jgi:hypothetical protein